PPVQMAKTLSHNYDLASAAAHQVWDGEYGLALSTMLEIPQAGAEGAASIVTGPIEAALEVPDMVQTAIDASDPEVKGAAAVGALQAIATVVMTAVAVGEAAKGPGGGPVKSGAAVDEGVIRNAMKDAPLKTDQGAVSLPAVQRYVDRLAAG